MIPDLLLVILFVGLVALVAWALNKRSSVLNQAPLEKDVIPVFESPLVLQAEAPKEQAAPEPVEPPADAVPADVLQVVEVAPVVEAAPVDVPQAVEAAPVVQTPPKNRGGRPKKVVAPAPVVAPVEPTPPKKRGGRPKKVKPTQT